MNIAEILSERAAEHPQRPAIVETRRGADRSSSFADLDRASRQAAHLLGRAGIGRGDRVLVFCPMSTDLYVALMGLFRLGAVAMFLDPSASVAHIDQCCAIGEPAGFIGVSRAHLLRLRSRALREIGKRFVVGIPVPGATRWNQRRKLEPLATLEPLDEDAPALLTFTSGSTGTPKAALRSHGFLLAQHRALAESLAMDAGRIDLTTLPIFLLANLASGLTSVIPDADLRAPAAIDPARVIAQIDHHQPTSTVASPVLLLRLADYCEKNHVRLSSFEHIYTGGAPVFPAALDRLHHVAPDAEIVAVYGSTEAEPIAHIARSAIAEADRAAMRRGAGLIAGTPVSCIDLRILPDDWGTPLGRLTPDEFDRRCLGREEPGEIVVCGEHVLKGYLHGAGDTESKFQVGSVVWHRTGDAGRLDRDGRLWLLGRCGAKVKDDDGVLYPFGVECAAQQHPAVARAAFIQHEDRRVLVVQPSRERGDARSIDALREELAWAKIAEVRSIDRLPVDQRHNAKIDYPALRRQLGG